MLRKISFERGTREQARGERREPGVDPAVTLSRLCGPPAERLRSRRSAATFAYPPLLLCAAPRMQSRNAVRERRDGAFFDAAL